MLGNKINPYPYFKKCDIYVQPSRHEGYCITLAEARVFNKPIVTTDSIGAKEQIINNKTGLIVKFNEDDLVMAISKIIDNKELTNNFISNFKNEDNNKKSNIKSLYELI